MPVRHARASWEYIVVDGIGHLTSSVEPSDTSDNREICAPAGIAAVGLAAQWFRDRPKTYAKG